MLSLFIFVIISIGIAVFATENTQTVWISFAQYRVENVPIYLVALGGLLVGIFISLLVSLVTSLSTTLSLRGKESSMRVTQQAIARLEDRVHALELENESLQEEQEEAEPMEQPSLSPFSQVNKRFL